MTQEDIDRLRRLIVDAAANVMKNDEDAAIAKLAEAEAHLLEAEPSVCRDHVRPG